jgi:3'-5' exoribonuclease
MHTDIGELRPNQNIDDVYLVKECRLRSAKSGNYYLHLVLGDKTGALQSRMWNATEALYNALAGVEFVRVAGRIEVFQDALQLIVNTVRRVPPEQVKVEDFLPATKNDVAQMLAKLKALGATVTNEHLAKLLEAFFADAGFVEKFKKAPAAVSYHQPYLGGLLEHTLAVAELADLVAAKYPQLDRNLFITGTILHDIGKIDELAYSRAFAYTDRGQLIGHLIIGIEMVQEHVRGIEGFPTHLCDLLCHMILSHHGEYEWGSPKLPMTPEAIALHHLDNLDAKVEASTRAIETDRLTEGNWTEYSRMFQRTLYKGPGAVSEE